MTYAQALDQWAPEARKTKDNFERMRLWIKWGSKVRLEDKQMVDKFTGMLEAEVFKDGS